MTGSSPNPSQPPYFTHWLARLRQQDFWLQPNVVRSGVGIALLLPIVLGGGAILYMVQLAELPDCRKRAWSSDSLSARLYCADELASKQNVDHLRDAIRLVSSIPLDDPLRPEGDRRAQRWSQELLRQAETAIQTGKLDLAIAAVNSIPEHSQVYLTANRQVQEWKDLWEKAETICEQATTKIEEKQWSEAIATARDLLKLGNEYWSVTRYQELMADLTAAREAQKSAAANDKTKERAKPAPKLSDWEEAYAREAAAHMVKANKLASSGTLAGLEAAISEAQQVMFGSPGYDEVQKKIATWEQQLESMTDRGHLDRAIQLASRGDEGSLQAGIEEAYKVSPNRGLHNEARKRIEQWNEQLYRLRYAPVESSQPEIASPRTTESNRPTLPDFPVPTVSPMPAGFSDDRPAKPQP